MLTFVKPILAASMLVAVSVVGSTPAQADGGSCDNPPLSGTTTIQSVTPSPTAVVVGLRQPVLQTFTVVVNDPCPVDVAVSNLTSYDGSEWQDAVTVSFGQGTKAGDTWTFVGSLIWDPATLSDGAAGSWTPATYAYGSGYDGTYAGTFTVAHATRLTADVESRRTRGVRVVTVSGRLRTADWEQHAWTGLAAGDVALQYKSHHGQWTQLQTTATDATGAASFTVSAAEPGCYRLVFAGSDGNAGSTSAAECVPGRHHS